MRNLKTNLKIIMDFIKIDRLISKFSRSYDTLVIFDFLIFKCVKINSKIFKFVMYLYYESF